MKNFQENSNPLFEKRTVTELSDSEMTSIDGGTTPWCVISLITLFTLVTARPAY